MGNNDLTWIELDSRAFKKNITTIKRLAGKRKIAAAVKANAYGHGLPEITALLKKCDIEYLAVHTLEEAKIARRTGWARSILIVGYIPKNQLEAVIEHELEPTVYSIDIINQLGKISQRYNKPVNLHLKIETGTFRLGILPKKIDSYVKCLKKYPNLKLKGVSTHFANIEDTTDHSYANKQLKIFNSAVSRIRKLGLRPKLRHTACSAAMILFEKTKLEMVRPGIALYGLWPSKETYLSYRLMGGSNKILFPILSWYTRVIQIKEIPADSFIGYGCTYRTTSKSRLAVLPVGYCDGYDRSLSNLAYVLIRGRRAPIRGRICMNLIMVDITDIQGVKLEEKVTLLGRDGKEYIGADQLADWAGTLNYEILSRIGINIPRLVI
jgi:alanine racemase